jgi:hypothetical protein
MHPATSWHLNPHAMYDGASTLSFLSLTYSNRHPRYRERKHGMGEFVKTISPPQKVRSKRNVAVHKCSAETDAARKLDVIEDALREVVEPAVDLLTKTRPTRTGYESITRAIGISITLGSLNSHSSTYKAFRKRHEEVMAVAVAALTFSLITLDLFHDLPIDGDLHVSRDVIVQHTNACCGYLGVMFPMRYCVQQYAWPYLTQPHRCAESRVHTTFAAPCAGRGHGAGCPYA